MCVAYIYQDKVLSILKGFPTFLSTAVFTGTVSVSHYLKGFPTFWSTAIFTGTVSVINTI